ncbi:MAG: SDR family oxidoreductase [Vulcanimicrobiota bacterium]
MPTELPPEMTSPGRYIEKVSLSGEVLEEDIKPEHLLVRKHRDYHVVDVYARHLMSRFVEATGDEEQVKKTMKEARKLGMKASKFLAKALGSDPEKISRKLFGLKSREYYFRYKKHPHTKAEIDASLARLREEAHQALEACRDGDRLRLRVLLTGGTGFVGKEILWQAALDPNIEKVYVLIRPKTIRDRKTKEVLEIHTPAMRGRELLRTLLLEETDKFHFLAGDIEEPRLGVSDDDYQMLAGQLTHVIHCAASVAFDDPYEESFAANVLGSLNALEFSMGLQEAQASPFVAHLSIETSYIHGRQVHEPAREDEIVFPRNFYNNYYELTKAMASLETERFMLEKGLRVVQLCPAIVIGDARYGNNRGDLKVVNAPVNAFGRARENLKDSRGDWLEFSKAWMLYRMAALFPGDASAELNLIPVDWVARGILAATARAQAVGERIHLATDNRITAEMIQQVVGEELKVDVKLADPTLHRTVQLPIIAKVLAGLKQKRLAGALQKLGSIFGGYSEWGQPVHLVGNDVTILGLPEPRPNTEQVFRMLCRHNKYVQRFGIIKDPEEIARREKVWTEFIERLEEEKGVAVGALPTAEFHEALYGTLDTDKFDFKTSVGQQ